MVARKAEPPEHAIAVPAADPGRAGAGAPT